MVLKVKASYTPCILSEKFLSEKFLYNSRNFNSYKNKMLSNNNHNFKIIYYKYNFIIY